MSQRNQNKRPILDLKLNLSLPPPRRNLHMNESPNQSPPTTSPESSSVSSEVLNNNDDNSTTETTLSMVLVGCPNCLLYVMLSEKDPKCPKCKSSVLLNVSQDNTNNPTKRTTKKNY
ncbi:hypothetical protein Leryth_008840 [Lithospermum erythrorhizon]|nr:hypothetical protein Leryth_008840 [Lithospermum erythrorhizon]